MTQPENFSGILFVNKQKNDSSNRTVQKVKQIFRNKYGVVVKLGHTGTLDPFAEGLLILCLGRATKIAKYLFGVKKSYQACLRLGQETDTQDLTGKIVKELPVGDYSEVRIREVLHQFRGTSEQIPPVFSALKHEGKPLYKLARKGKFVIKPMRKIHIDRIKLLSYSSEFQRSVIRFEVSCSKGTYVRTLGKNIAEFLGTCGHLIELKRMSIAGFCLADALEIKDLEQSENPAEFLKPTDEILQDLPVVRICDEHKRRLFFGQRISLSEFSGELSDFNLSSFQKNFFRAYEKNTGNFFGIIEVLPEKQIFKLKTIL